MFLQLSQRLSKLAMEKYASITFSLGYDHENSMQPELDKHKSEEHKKIEQEIKDLSKTWNNNLSDEEKAKMHHRYEELQDELYEHDEKIQPKKDELTPSVNFANANATIVLKALGYVPDYSGTLKVSDLLQRIMKLKNKSKKGLKPLERPESEGDNWIEFGLTSDDIMKRVMMLENLAKKAVALGKEEIEYS